MKYFTDWALLIKGEFESTREKLEYKLTLISYKL